MKKRRARDWFDCLLEKISMMCDAVEGHRPCKRKCAAGRDIDICWRFDRIAESKCLFPLQVCCLETWDTGQIEEEKNMQLKWKTCLQVGTTGLALFLLIHYWDGCMGVLGSVVHAAMPLILGCAIAYVINILMRFLETHFPIGKNSAHGRKIRRPICLILAIVLIILIVVLIVRMVVPELIACLEVVAQQLPGALNTAYNWLETHFQISEFLQSETISLPTSDAEWREILGKVANAVAVGVSGIMGTAVSVISSVVSRTVTAAVALVFSLYLLIGKETIGRQGKLLIHTYLPEKLSHKIFYVLETLDHSFHSFIVGQCTEAVILGLLCTVGMVILRLPYAAMVGSLIGCTALIPIAGAYIGGGISAFMIFTVSPMKAVVFLIYLVILQQAEGNLIYPRVVGSSIGLPGIWVLAAVTIGGGVAGIGGMLLGVPLTAAIYQILKVDVHQRQKPETTVDERNQSES